MSSERWGWRLAGQWVLIIASAIGIYVSQDRRITSLEAGWVEERNGYIVMTTNLVARLDRLEGKLDRLIERSN